MPVSYLKDIAKLEKGLGYSFNNRELINEALTHKSFHHENPDKVLTNNERLEFLGDSVLGLTVVEYLFNCNPGLSEALMSKIKSYIVRGSLLSEVAAELNLGLHLRLGKGEDDTGGRRKENVLADAMEAVIGAVYIDSGYAAAREVILRLLKKKIISVITSGQYCDYKTELQEKSQMVFGVLPEYRVIKQEGEEHLKTFTVNVFIAGEKYGRGVGKSKKEAQTEAAKEALERIKDKQQV